MSGALDLRGRRESLGLTLEQVSEATRIPIAILQAIESDRFDNLPKGAYRNAYIKAYRKHLGWVTETKTDDLGATVVSSTSTETEPSKRNRSTSGTPRSVRRTATPLPRVRGPVPVRTEAEAEAPLPPPPTPPRFPLWVVRLVAGITCVILLGTLIWSLYIQGLPRIWLNDTEVAQSMPQVVNLTALRDFDLRVLADGVLIFDRRVISRERLEFQGKHEIIVELPVVEVARLSWNGRDIVPQGRQDEARRLRFIDDRAEK